MTDILCKFDWQEKTQRFLLLLSPIPSTYGNFRIEKTKPEYPIFPRTEENMHRLMNLVHNHDLNEISSDDNNWVLVKIAHCQDQSGCGGCLALALPLMITFDERPSWSPSWLELGKIMEVLRFTDFLNSWKFPKRLEFKEIIGDSWRSLDNVLSQPWFDYRLREKICQSK